MKSIFEEGVKAKDNGIDLYMCQLGGAWQSVNEMKQEMNNWGHKDAEFVVLFRFPYEYLATNTPSPFDTRRFGVFYNEGKSDDFSERGTYDTKFIIGAYDRSTGNLIENPNYADIDDPDVKKELDAKFTNVVSENQRVLDEMSPSRVGSPLKGGVADEMNTGASTRGDNTESNSAADEWVEFFA
ncbi:MAG: hypothetical protein LBC95_02605 [Candidatus Nomurabacteria bacterium]|nr:hypothetical protein [Candidatus Nomurabacteria bacterium]